MQKSALPYVAIAMYKNEWADAADFDKNIYRLASLVPAGFVTTYGQLAGLVGRPNWARRVGRALSRASGAAPCHRVVNSQGRLVPGWEKQRQWLLDEKIQFKENGCVDMKRHRLSAEMWLSILKEQDEEQKQK